MRPMKQSDKQSNPQTAGTPGATMASGERVETQPSGNGRGGEEGGARLRVLNLLSRHPDLVAGHLERVALVLCEESALAMQCARVGLWQLDPVGQGDQLVETTFNGKRFEDLEARRLSRDTSPAFFAALERRRLLEGSGLHEFVQVAPESVVATVHLDGRVWGMVSFEREAPSTWFEADLDFALLVVEMIGRCVERGLRGQLEERLGRSEDALVSFARMNGDALFFEVVQGNLVCHGDPRLLLGPAPAGQGYHVDLLIGHIRDEEREILVRRFGDWASAGSPGVLTARFHYTAGTVGAGGTEVDLECRLLRSRTASGIRLWGVLRPA